MSKGDCFTLTASAELRLKTHDLCSIIKGDFVLNTIKNMFPYLQELYLTTLLDLTDAKQLEILN